MHSIEPLGMFDNPCIQTNIYVLHSSHEEGTLTNRLRSNDAAAPEYATLSKFQAPPVAVPNQSYMALGRNW